MASLNVVKRIVRAAFLHDAAVQQPLVHHKVEIRSSRKYLVNACIYLKAALGANTAAAYCGRTDCVLVRYVSECYLHTMAGLDVIKCIASAARLHDAAVQQPLAHYIAGVWTGYKCLVGSCAYYETAIGINAAAASSRDIDCISGWCQCPACTIKPLASA